MSSHFMWRHNYWKYSLKAENFHFFYYENAQHRNVGYDTSQYLESLWWRSVWNVRLCGEDQYMAVVQMGQWSLADQYHRHYGCNAMRYCCVHMLTLRLAVCRGMSGNSTRASLSDYLCTNRETTDTFAFQCHNWYIDRETLPKSWYQWNTRISSWNAWNFKLECTRDLHSNLLAFSHQFPRYYQVRPMKCAHFKWNVHISHISMK